MPVSKLYDLNCRILEMFRAEFTAEQFATSYMKIFSKIAITVTNMKRKFY